MSRPLSHGDLEQRLAAYALEVLDDPERTAVALHVVSCASCRSEVDRYRQVVRGLSSAKERTWERMSDSLAARREELDDLLNQLAGAPEPDPEAPSRLRVVVAADTHAASLCRRLAQDLRFSVVGTAAEALDLLSVTGAHQPDLLVVALSGPHRDWLDCLGEVSHWSPSTKVVMVTAVDADGVARLVSSAGEAGAWSGLVSSGSMTAGDSTVTTPTPGQAAPPSDRLPASRRERRVARRSIIDEAMWQMGISSRGRR